MERVDIVRVPQHWIVHRDILVMVKDPVYHLLVHRGKYGVRQRDQEEVANVSNYRLAGKMEIQEMDEVVVLVVSIAHPVLVSTVNAHAQAHRNVQLEQIV